MQCLGRSYAARRSSRNASNSWAHARSKEAFPSPPSLEWRLKALASTASNSLERPVRGNCSNSSIMSSSPTPNDGAICSATVGAQLPGCVREKSATCCSILCRINAEAAAAVSNSAIRWAASTRVGDGEARGGGRVTRRPARICASCVSVGSTPLSKSPRTCESCAAIDPRTPSTPSSASSAGTPLRRVPCTAAAALLYPELPSAVHPAAEDDGSSGGAARGGAPNG